MEARKTGWKPKLLMLVVSSFFIIAILGVAELYCRMFTGINFLDNSRGLFAYNRFGNTYGNTPNFEGISFGEPFRTDENGFRIDPATYERPATDNPAILIMGDSVAFGPAIPESQTISGNLRSRVSGSKIYNGAAIGYDTFDQRNATLGFVNEHPEIKSVFAFFCLNDVSDASAQMIRSRTPQTSEAVAESVSILRRINDFLRSRSKLFLWLKNALVDIEMSYFQSDLLNYQKGEANVFASLQPIAELKNELVSRGVRLKVFITPYEAQLRPGTPQEFLQPQQLVTQFLRQNDVEYYDTTPDFQRASNGSSSLFLYGDPMHLSADGTKLVADVVCANTDACG